MSLYKIAEARYNYYDKEAGIGTFVGDAFKWGGSKVEQLGAKSEELFNKGKKTISGWGKTTPNTGNVPFAPKKINKPTTIKGFSEAPPVKNETPIKNTSGQNINWKHMAIGGGITATGAGYALGSLGNNNNSNNNQ